jgi:drug/metabolite transporter (DMT)-like permease
VDDILFAIITMMAPLMWAIYTILGTSLVQHYPPLLVTGVSMMFAGAFSIVLLSPSLLTKLPAFPSSFWWSILFLSLPCTVFGFVIWFWALGRLPASRVASFVYLVPMFGVTCSRVLLKEPITMGLFIGAMILIAGMYLVNRKERKSASS